MTFQDFEQAPSEAWESYWKNLVSNQGAEPSAAVKKKRMAKFYKQHVDETFDVASVTGAPKPTAPTAPSPPPSSSTSASGSTQRSRRSAAPHTARPTSTPPSTASASGTMSDVVAYARARPRESTRLGLHVAGAVPLVLGAVFSGSYWFTLGLFLQLCCNALALWGKVQRPAGFNMQAVAMAIQPIMLSEQGQTLTYLFLLFATPPFAPLLLPLMAAYAFQSIELRQEWRGPSLSVVSQAADRIFGLVGRGLGGLTTGQAHALVAQLEISLLPILIASRLVLSRSSIGQIVLYGYTFLMLRYLTKRSHRDAWRSVNARLQEFKRTYGSRAPWALTALAFVEQKMAGMTEQASRMPAPLP